MRNENDNAPGLLTRGLLVSAALATALAIALTGLESRSVGEAARPATGVGRDLSGRVTPDDIRRMLARHGFAEIAELKPRGPNFTAQATTGDGITARFVISGADGAILGLRVVEPGQETRRADAARR